MCKAIKSGQYPFVMCNFAPPDMVGHTGKYEPAIKGCEATGESVVKLKSSCMQMNKQMQPVRESIKTRQYQKKMLPACGIFFDRGSVLWPIRVENLEIESNLSLLFFFFLVVHLYYM